MRETLDKESRLALIRYRIKRAEHTLKEAEVMIRESFFNAAINRMYYACYYAAVALLLQHNMQTQTHSGVKMLLGLHFVSTGLLPIETGKTFSTLFEKRHSSDYDDFVYCDREMAEALYPKAQTFVETLKQLIESQENSPKRI